MQLGSSTLVALALCLGASPGRAQETTSTAAAVCKSKTINYITHTLPQQCLRTNWASANSSDHASATEGPGPATTVVTVVETATKTQEVRPGETGVQPEPAGKQSVTEDKKDDGAAEGKAAQKRDDDSDDLATSSFMSFEEWKAMMLQKSGQDPADLRGRKHQEHRDAAEIGSNEGLDTWGDDGEIALEFDVLSGKISEMAATAGVGSGSASAEATNAETQEPALHDDGMAHYRRPKDAGKTCKERFSYSSFDGGATVLKTSPGAKNAKAILVENKDSYMLFTCSQENKFVIVELSEDILVDTVVLANFEFFSSMIRNFRVSVSDKYPVKMEKWKDVGTFQARNSRDIQSFLIENPKIWAKYIRIEFLSHYGNEYYCPVSLLRVHGTRMLDSWKDAEAGADDDEPAETITGPDAVPEQEVLQENATVPEPEATGTPDHTAPAVLNESVHDYGQSPWYSPLHSESHLATCRMGTPTTSEVVEASAPAQPESATAAPVESPVNTEEAAKISQASEPTASPPLVSPPSVDTPTSTTQTPSNASVPTASETTVSKTEPPASQIQQPSPESAKSGNAKPSTPQTKSPSGSRVTNQTSSRSSSKQPSNSVQNKNGSSTASSPAASPTVQESFFKSISKRLQFLESNTTLSLQYIEDQSKFLREALQKMERKQISRVDSFLDNLNNTVLTELRNFQQQYDQIWQSTVLALESQREQSQREVIALSSRLNLLADEVVFQKRMAIFQSVILLCCLVLVLFSRGVLGTAAPGDQHHWSTVASTSHFFNTYLGSPRWAPASPPRFGSRQNTPKQQQQQQQQQRRPDDANLCPNGLQRSVSGPAAVAMTHNSPSPSSYAEKMLPLTPTSDGFGINDSENGSPTPPTTLSQPPPPPPSIRVDAPDIFFGEQDPPDDEVYEICHDDFSSSPEQLKVGRDDGRSSEEESSSGASTLADERQGSAEEEDEADCHVHEPAAQSTSKPPLTRSLLSDLGGNSRKPLPALPENPT